MSTAEQRRKLLIVERKLVSNRGHHHTQIAALSMLLSDYEPSFVAGEAYDGFMGPAAGKLGSGSVKLTRLRSRLRHGSFYERLGATFSALKGARTLALPASAFGGQLIGICRDLTLGPDDLIVIPTADLDALESAIELTAAVEGRAPVICLRFLSPDLGDRNGKFRALRLSAAAADMPSNIHLFTETEELARYFRENYNLSVTGGFYLSCSMPVALSEETIPAAQKSRHDRRFRIGVFGEPRPEKGSARIAGIVAAAAKLATQGTGCPLDFVVQGSAQDFSEGGVYAALRSFDVSENGDAGSAICVIRAGNRISPVEFERLFNSVDAILLPYERPVYAFQGSGVVQDAVAAHKPIVHIEGMSMGAFLSHGNAVAATTDEEFAAAILRLAKNPTHLSQATADAAAHFEDVLANNPILRVLGEGTSAAIDQAAARIA